MKATIKGRKRFTLEPSAYHHSWFRGMRWTIGVLFLIPAVFQGGCRRTDIRPDRTPWDPVSNIEALNSLGHRLTQVEVGQTLNVGLRGLKPDRSYRVELADEHGRLVSFYQLTADARGTIESSPLWYHSGVTDCSRLEQKSLAPYRFRTFEEARKVLAGRRFYLTVRDVQGRVIGRRELPVVKEVNSSQTLVYFSDSSGCLRNSFRAGKEDIYVTAKHLPPEATLQVFLVPNKYGWRPGMPLYEVRSGFREKPQIIRLKEGQTSFTERIWTAEQAGLGAYDLILRVNREDARPILLKDDLVAYIQDTGMLVQFAYDPPWAPNDFDIAGRLDKNNGYPYFEFHDVFAVGDMMWGAVDPAMVPAAHPGGSYAAYYVIPHGSAGSGLTDITEALEIVPVKAGCINASMTRIWNQPSPVGEYDVVVDFGLTPAGSLPAWVADNTFNPGVDFIDRAAQVGAYVVQNPAEPGPYSVLSWTYAPDPANPADPLWTDVSTYFNSPDSRVSITMDKVPLHGLVRYPDGAGPFPLVLIVHGNHSPLEASEPGYLYLCNLLASHGIIAVTVDENYLNGRVLGEMDARAIVLLRHLQRWRTWNGTVGHPFYNKVDLSRIGLAGHSRGGEAITVARLFNSSLHNPGDPNHDFNFSIKSLFAIAPVDGQIDVSYPGTPIVVENADYFVMAGSHDGDVYDFEGHLTYDRAFPVTSAPSAIKSLLWVYGANHGKWNTVWGSWSETQVQPASDTISTGAQQAIGKVYMSAFCQMTLQDKKEYRALFTGDVTFDSLPPGVTRVHQYQDKDRLWLDHYEEDGDLATASYPGATNVNAGGLLSPYLQQSFSGGASNPYWLWQQTNGLIAGWSAAGAEYTINLPATIGSQVDTYPYLALRMGQVYENTAVKKNPPGTVQDFSIQLALGAVNSHSLKVSNFDGLPYPQEAHRGASNVTKTMMKTVRIPLRSFVVNQASWDLHNLSQIRLRFDQKPSGLLAIDEIQLTK